MALGVLAGASLAMSGCGSQRADHSGSRPRTHVAASSRSGGTLAYRYLTNSSSGTLARRYGYNLVDLGPNLREINSLPAGEQALVWLGGYDRDTCAFSISDPGVRRAVGPLAGDRKVAGYYVADEADDALPAYGGHCPGVAAQVAARSSLLHRLAPGTFTYEVVTEPADFAAFAHATDVLGADPYPCLQGHGCDWTMIPRYIAALRAAHIADYWGVLQVFSVNQWRYPTLGELRKMISQWSRSSWQGEQTFAYEYSGQSLASHPDLLAELGALNRRLGHLT